MHQTLKTVAFLAVMAFLATLALLLPDVDPEVRSLVVGSAVGLGVVSVVADILFRINDARERVRRIMAEEIGRPRSDGAS